MELHFVRCLAGVDFGGPYYIVMFSNRCKVSFQITVPVVYQLLVTVLSSTAYLYILKCSKVYGLRSISPHLIILPLKFVGGAPKTSFIILPYISDNMIWVLFMKL